jgi:hypothetical protein
VLFRGGRWQNGAEFLKDRPNPPFQLKWGPDEGGVSAAGDLGWDTGASEFIPADGSAVGYGQFLTVWGRHTDGSWKFMIDHGISCPGPVHSGASTGESVLPSPASPADPLQALQAIDQAEQAFAKERASDLTRAIKATLTSSCLVLREEAFPARGIDAALPLVQKDPAGAHYVRVGVGAADSGELGYSYGTVLWLDKDKPAYGKNRDRAGAFGWIC